MAEQQPGSKEQSLNFSSIQQNRKGSLMSQTSMQSSALQASHGPHFGSFGANVPKEMPKTPETKYSSQPYSSQPYYYSETKSNTRPVFEYSQFSQPSPLHISPHQRQSSEKTANFTQTFDFDEIAKLFHQRQEKYARRPIQEIDEKEIEERVKRQVIFKTAGDENPKRISIVRNKDYKPSKEIEQDYEDDKLLIEKMHEARQRSHRILMETYDYFY